MEIIQTHIITQEKPQLNLKESKKQIEDYATIAIDLMYENEKLTNQKAILLTYKNKILEVLKKYYNSIPESNNNTIESQSSPSYTILTSNISSLKSSISNDISSLQSSISALQTKKEKLLQKLSSYSDEINKIKTLSLHNFVLQNIFQEKHSIIQKSIICLYELIQLSIYKHNKETYLNDYLGTNQYNKIAYIEDHKKEILNLNIKDNSLTNKKIIDEKIKTIKELINSQKKRIKILKSQIGKKFVEKGYLVHISNKKYNKELIFKFDENNLLYPELSSDTENYSSSDEDENNINEDIKLNNKSEGSTSTFNNASYVISNPNFNNKDNLNKIICNINKIKNINNEYKNIINKYNKKVKQTNFKIDVLREYIKLNSMGYFDNANKSNANDIIDEDMVEYKQSRKISSQEFNLDRVSKFNSGVSSKNRKKTNRSMSAIE